jgi:hypothetical protein
MGSRSVSKENRNHNSIDGPSRESQGDKLIGLIYLHDIADLRYTGSAKTSFELFHNLRGPPVNVVIVTTHWHDKGTKYYEKQQSLYQMFQEGPWKGWINGEELHQTDDTPENTKEILRTLLINEARVYKVQWRVYEAQRRAPKAPKNKKEEWRFVKAARVKLEQDLTLPRFNSTDLEGQLRLLKAWEGYTRPSGVSRFLLSFSR